MAFTISPQLTLWFIGMVALLTLIIVLMSRLVNPLCAHQENYGPNGYHYASAVTRDEGYPVPLGRQLTEEAEFNEVNQDYTKWHLGGL